MLKKLADVWSKDKAALQKQGSNVFAAINDAVSQKGEGSESYSFMSLTKLQSKAVCAKALHAVFLRQATSAGTLQSQSEEAAKNAIDDAYRQLKKSFDEVYGGFSTAPKFPKPSEIALMFVTQHMLRIQDMTEGNEGEKVHTSVRFICG